MQLAYKRCKHLEIVEMKKVSQKIKYQSNPEIKKQYKKKYHKSPELYKKNKKIMYQQCQEKKKVLIRLRIFFKK